MGTKKSQGPDAQLKNAVKEMQPTSGLLLLPLTDPSDSWPNNPNQLLNSYSYKNHPIAPGASREWEQGSIAFVSGTIGSSPSATITLKNRNLEPIHARITQGLSGAKLYDTGTGKGTFILVNAHCTRSFHPLTDGSKFWVGEKSFVISSITISSPINDEDDEVNNMCNEELGLQNMVNRKKQVTFNETVIERLIPIGDCSVCHAPTLKTTKGCTCYVDTPATEIPLDTYCREWCARTKVCTLQIHEEGTSELVFEAKVREDSRQRPICVVSKTSGDSVPKWKNWDHSNNNQTHNNIEGDSVFVDFESESCDTEVLCYLDFWDNNVFLVDGLNSTELAKCMPKKHGVFVQVPEVQKHPVMPCDVFFLGETPFSLATYGHVGFINQGALVISNSRFVTRPYFVPIESKHDQDRIGSELRSRRTSLTKGWENEAESHFTEFPSQIIPIIQGITNIGNKSTENTDLIIKDFRLGKRQAFVQVEQSFAKLCNVSRSGFIRFLCGRSDLSSPPKLLANDDVFICGRCTFQVHIKSAMRTRTISEMEKIQESKQKDDLNETTDRASGTRKSFHQSRRRRPSAISAGGTQLSSLLPLQHPHLRLREGAQSLDYESLKATKNEWESELEESTTKPGPHETDHGRFLAQKATKAAAGSGVLGNNESVSIDTEYKSASPGFEDDLVPEFCRDKLGAAVKRLHVSHPYMTVRDSSQSGNATETYLELQSVKGPARYRKVALYGDRITIGSRSDNNITINDSSVSAHHAIIYRVKGKYYLQDRQSMLGTAIVLDSFRDTTTLQAGDTFQAAETEFQFMCTYNKPIEEESKKSSKFACSVS